MDDELRKLLLYFTQEGRIIAKIEKEAGEVKVLITLSNTFQEQEFHSIIQQISDPNVLIEKIQYG